MLKKRATRQLEVDNLHHDAGNELKNELVTQLVLVLSRLNKQYTIDTDAYVTQKGCGLLQEQEGKALKPFGYWSRSLCDAETRYDTIYN